MVKKVETRDHHKGDYRVEVEPFGKVVTLT